MEKITLNYSASGQKLKPLYSLKKFASDTVNYVVAVFDLDESWAFDSVRAVWKTENACISTALDQDGACTVPQEVLQKKAKVEVNLVGSDVEENQLTERLTTYPVQAFIVDRDVPICGSETAEITPSQFEQFVQIVTAEVAKIRDVDRVELNDDYTITFYYSDGTESPKIGPIRGETGADGNGIQNITKIGSEGRIDTYRIIYTNGEHFDFNVTNGEKGDKGEQGETGNGIDRIEKTATVGSVDTYTIYFTDGTTTTFDVTDGEVTNAVLDEATIVQTNTDNVPYLFRPSGGDVRTGRKEFDTIVGGTVAWNQLVQKFVPNGATVSTDDATTTVSHDGTSRTWFGVGISDGVSYNFKPLANHKYFWCVNITNISVTNFRQLMFAQGIIGRAITTTGISCSIGVGVGGTGLYFNANMTQASTSTGDTFTFKDMMLIDLTQLFGTTIADYIYNLEQANAGAGVAWFRQYFPNDYYPYDPGTLRSVEGVSAHETVGFNQWDEEWENGTYLNVNGTKYPSSTKIRNVNPIRVLPNTQYYYHVGSTSADEDRIWFYEADMTFISSVAFNHHTSINQQFTTPSNCSLINFAVNNTTYKNDICINLSDPSRNGEYEPYQKHTYPLDSSLTLRGVPKLVDGKLAYDGDVYPPSGEVQRRYGIVDLGALNWDVYNGKFTSTLKPEPLRKTGGNINMVCPKYTTGAFGSSTSQGDKKIWLSASTSSNTLYVEDSTYTDAASFKTAMSGVYLVYEKATPTTETADGYEQYQTCDPSGTEEYVGSPIPVGHETDYPMTLTDTMPTANGTYTLNLTVANGKRSVSWTNELAVAIAAL